MTLDHLNVGNQAGGRRRGRKAKSRKAKSRGKKGGSFLADASVPAGLFLLHRFMKKRKSMKLSKKNKKGRKTRRRK